MFFNILKKDLKRGVTMNIIILLFIALSVMFIAGSVNSIVAVTTSLDNYFEKAEVPDVIAAMLDKAEVVDIEEVLKDDKNLYKDIKVEKKLFFVDGSDIILSNGKESGYDNTFLCGSVDDYVEKIFDENNKEITEVKKGELYVVQKVINSSDLKVGDTVTVKMDGIQKEFKIAGIFKDAVMGSVLMGNGRMVFNLEDAEELYADAKEHGKTGKMYYFYTDKTKELQNRLNETDASFIFIGDKALIKSSYIMDMVAAIFLMVVSLILIVVALIVLRFTISFTISSEFREIGVMKAIGIGNMKIRSLYLAKYLAISVVASVIGVAASIPFGKLMIDVTSNTIMIEAENDLLISIISAVMVVAIVMLFGLHCTKKANKFSPVDAIRNGETGERFRKKGFLHLSKSRMGATTFLAGNDVLSAPKRYIIIIVVFALAILPIQFLDIVASSLSQKEMLSNLSAIPSDVAFFLKDDSYMYTTDGSGKQVLIDQYKEIEKTLAENGMPGRVFSEVLISSRQEFNGNTTKVMAIQGVNNKSEDHKCIKGSNPANPGEVAITPKVSEALEADIGDVIKVSVGDKQYDLMVSGIFEAMINTGESIRLHEDLDVNYNYSNGNFGTQILFDDNPSEKESKERIKKLEKIFPDYTNFQTGSEMAESITEVGPTFTMIKKLFLLLSIAIVIMVAILMERSMIIKETAEIATLKAIGFTDYKIVKWHAKRFIITAIISAVIAGTLALPLTKLAADPIFAFMGVGQGVKYSFSVVRVCVVYPVIAMAFMTLSILLSSLYTRKITAQQTSSIE